MDKLELKYPLKKLMIFALGAILGVLATALTAYDIWWTDEDKLSWHFTISAIIAVTNLGMAVRALQHFPATPVFTYEDE